MPHDPPTNSAESIPPDDLQRKLAIGQAEGSGSPHLSIAGDTYTVLLGGKETAGKYCLIDMHVPPGGGPPPHRHDFEEMLLVTEGELQVTFRGQESTLRAGQAANIPANAPHFFKNVSNWPTRLLCMCAPAGQEEFFLAVGDRVADRTAPPPRLSDEQKAARQAKAQALAGKYRTEFLPPTAG